MSLAWLLVVTLVATGGVAEPEAVNGSSPEIVALYPNPVDRGDPGEFIVVDLQVPTRTDDWVFVDDAGQRARPPPMLVEGTVAFSFEPDLAARFTDAPVYRLDGWLQLADAGQTVELRIDGRVVDRVSYDGPAPVARLWVRDRTPEPWRPLGATTFEPVDDSASITAFALPDATWVPIELLEGARERLLVGGYTFAETRVVDALIEAHTAGVEVAVHVEGRPVGGISEAMGNALDRLVHVGVPVSVHRGPYARWGYHHPKYAVVDDRVLVMTENWHADGVGGGANRGWGVVVDSPVLADALAAVFDAERDWFDADPWVQAREGVDRHPDDVTGGTYPPAFDPETVGDASVTMIVAPDNAEVVLTGLIANATESVDIVQVRVSDADFPLMRAAFEAAERGVRVRLLLSGAWYVERENRALADELHRLAEVEGLDLEVRLVDATTSFERVHAKGVIIDERTVVVSSINWNNHSLRANREVGVIIDDPAVGAYFTAVFEADWAGDPDLIVPLDLVLVTALAGGLGLLHARRLEFDDAEAPKTRKCEE